MFTNWQDLALRLRALICRKRVEQELRDELDFHLEMESRKNASTGMGEREAIRRAHVEFGGGARIQEECRDARGIGFFDTTFQDIRFAMRSFRRSPTLVFTVIATIALGLGINTAVFTIFNATYLRTIAVRDPHSLYELSWMDRAGETHGFTWQAFQDFLPQNSAFSESLGYKNVEARLDGRTVPATLVTNDYFSVLGINAHLGRTVLANEAAVVLSYEAWQNRFSADADIVGKKVLLQGYPFEIAGVAAQGFTGLGSRHSDFWAPLIMWKRFVSGPDLFGQENPRSLSIVGRLEPEFSTRQAQAGLTLWAQRFTANEARAAQALQATLDSRASAKPLNLSRALAFLPLLIGFSLVLLIGCANVANMMLARSISRQRELGIRLSLGASRRRLVRQLLTESILLALPAAVAGVAVSQGLIQVCVHVLRTTLPPGISDFGSRIPALPWDGRVFGFSLAAALLSAIAFGLPPAMLSTRGDLTQAARGDFAGGLRPSLLRNALVIGQVTACVLLLISAGMLLRGADTVHGLDGGLSSRDTIKMVVQDKSREAVLNRLASEPFVDTVASATSAPVDRKPRVGVRTSEDETAVNTSINRVSPEYFTVFELPIVRGRNFTAAEAHSNAPVAVISQATAQRLWPKKEAVGAHLQLVAAGSRPVEQVEVIGVARDELSRWIMNGEDAGLLYRPVDSRAAGTILFVDAPGNALTNQRRIEADLSALGPSAIEEIEKLQVREWVEEDAYFTLRIANWLTSAIGFLALLLTLSGIYGVISYVIAQRTKEIGIRMAMGATRGSVTGLVLKQAMRLAVIGTVAGCLLAIGVSKVLASVLVALSVFDGIAYFSGAVLVLLACAAAAYVPSRRASRVDPLTALRYD